MLDVLNNDWMDEQIEIGAAYVDKRTPEQIEADHIEDCAHDCSETDGMIADYKSK